MSELSKNLKQLRICRSITQNTLAEHLHCSTGTISNYENGVHAPDIDTLIDLADYYDVSVSYLLGHSTGNSSDDILSQVIYGRYTIGRFVRLLAYLEKKDLFSLVHYLILLEKQRMPRGGK